MLANRVREYTLTTGAGDITLAGALPGHVTFAEGFSLGDSVDYVLEDGDNYEIGTGTLQGATIFQRTSVKETLVGGVFDKSAPAPIGLSGNARIFCAATADFLLNPHVLADTVSEATAGAGVAIDGVVIKDSDVSASLITAGDQFRGASNGHDVRLDPYHVAIGHSVVGTNSGHGFSVMVGNEAALTFDYPSRAATFMGGAGHFRTGLKVGDDLIPGSYVDIVGAGSGQFGIRFGNETVPDSKASILTATYSADLVFERAGIETLRLGGSASRFSNLVELPHIARGTDTSLITISGGSASGQGANIRLGGENHASLANTTTIRTGSTAIARFDGQDLSTELSGALNVGGVLSAVKSTNLSGSLPAETVAVLRDDATPSGSPLLSFISGSGGFSGITFGTSTGADDGRIRYTAGNELEFKTNDALALTIGADQAVTFAGGVTSPSTYFLEGTGANAGIKAAYGVNAFAASGVGIGTTSNHALTLGANSLAAITVGTDRSTVFSGKVQVSISTIPGTPGDDPSGTSLRIDRNSNNSIQINSGNSNLGQLRFGDGDSSYRGAVSYSHSTDVLSLVAGGQEVLSLNGLTGDSTFGGPVIADAYTATGAITASTGAITFMDVSSGVHRVGAYNWTTGTPQPLSLAQDTLVLDPNDNTTVVSGAVGIGGSPSHAIHAQADATTTNIVAERTGVGASRAILQAGNESVFVGALSSDPLHIGTGGLPAISVGTDLSTTFAGNVGVNGDVIAVKDAFPGYVFQDSNTLTTGDIRATAGSMLYLADTGAAVANTYHRFDIDGAEVFRLAASGATVGGNLTLENTDSVDLYLNANTGDSALRFQESGITKATLGWDRSTQLFKLSNSNFASVDMLTVDMTTGDATFAGDIISGGNYYRDVSTESTIISGGTAISAGANMVAYGQNHATRANDIEFRADESSVLTYSHASTAWNFEGKNVDNIGQLNLGTATELTISADTITISKSFHVVDTEGGTATDDILTINGGAEGDILVLSSTSSARTIVCRSGGNLVINSDFSMNHPGDTISFIRDTLNWRELSRSNNL